MNTPAINLLDGYKIDHRSQYPTETSLIFSNWTARKSRNPKITHSVHFGLQAFIKEWLIDHYNRTFFHVKKNIAVSKYARRIKNTGNTTLTYAHIEKLWDLQYLPISIMSLPEGELIPIGVPSHICFNTLDDFYWVTNMLETLESTELWKPATSATMARELKKVFKKYSDLTCDNENHLDFQMWDFSMRGMSGVWDACQSGAGHLLSSKGSDTIPAIDYLEDYYNADSDKELISAGVNATEHSVACVGTGLYIKTQFNGDWKYIGEAEYLVFKRLITEVYQTGILSVVSDTWSLPKIVTEILPKLKKEILERDGVLVIRPDSFWTNPQDCLCGFDGHHSKMDLLNDAEIKMVRKGLVESLYDIFGGEKNKKGFITLHPKISSIYGDGLSIERSDEICDRLMNKGFASSNWVCGIGSFFYQMTSRDYFGWAMKCTYAEAIVDGKKISIEVFKDPITDKGSKKSAKGLTAVYKNEMDDYFLKDQATWGEVMNCELKEVFRDGKILYETSLSKIRERVKNKI